MNQLELKNYNLKTTLLGGQAFNWEWIDDSYYGFTQDKAIQLMPARQSERSADNLQTILWQTYPINNDYEFLKIYLNLGIDFENILKQINKDDHINKAINEVLAVRILNQDFEQTLLSFILSSHKNIKAVKKLVKDLAKAYGEKISVNDKQFYLFPKTEVLANLSEAELRKVGAGFRARYLKNAAQKLQNLSLESLIASSQEDFTRQKLIEFDGIGDKIADCIMTFSLGFTTVTPLDIWGKRVLIDLYSVDSKLKYSQMREWYRNYFGEHTSWAGQFLFEWYRQNYSVNQPSKLK